MNEVRTVELVRDLEQFRAAVLALTNLESADPRVPTHIFAFASTRDLRGMKLPRGYIGVFVPSMSANYVLFADSRDVEGERVLKHEYTHFLLNQGTLVDYPRWYHEGFADYMSTVDAVDGYVVVGAIPPDRAEVLSQTTWRSTRSILEYDASKQWSGTRLMMFYAQAWALVHYLQRNDAQRTALPQQLEHYVSAVANGDDADAASRAAFGLSAADLGRAVREHLRRGDLSSLGIPEADIPWSREVTVRSIKKSHAAIGLGHLALAGGVPFLAETLFEEALADDPSMARAHAGLGLSLTLRRRWGEAEQYLDRALALDPSDPSIAVAMGRFCGARGRDANNTAERDEWIRAARRHYVRANQLDGSLAEPYALYGATFLVEGQDAASGVETLEHAMTLLPSNLGIRFWLAQAYVAIGQFDEARALLRTIVSWDHDPDRATEAGALLDALAP